MNDKIQQKHYIHRLGHFIKSILLYIKYKVYLYQEHYLMENTSGIKKNLKTELDVDLKIISSIDDLEYLIENGFGLGEFFDLQDIKKKLSEGQILFCLFFNRNLVHTSWVVLGKKISFHPPLKLDYTKEFYIHFCITDPNFRGMGFYPYTLTKICDFFENEGLTAKITMEKSNFNSLIGAKKAGFTFCGEGIFLKVLNHVSWREVKFNLNDNNNNNNNFLSFHKNK